MSYHVLARRWRPQTFTEMVGQEHVLKALTNALSHDRLHHAYLFTGTRGVGKTTVARIFAKSLNCEQGVGPNPCGICSSCVEIAEGRFVDLIEVDAASRTKVEDTRDLLENVQYAPSRGRFKVYIIDEVHMLSTSSFNALLKTLEEPPEHVKFLLATTDPQKLPVTVLSRCLQFNLKNMSPERIVSHLQFVLGEEKVPFEDPALWLLAKAADGSMRDALSLTDQSIAFGNESVMESDVRNMLGTVDRAYVLHILESLSQQNAASILDEVSRAADHAPDFAGILDELISVLHRIAVGQMVPASVDNSQGDQEFILGMSQLIQPHDVHLFYQIGLASRKDMAAAADQRAALEMTLLRMLAFQIKRPGQTLPIPNTPLPNSEAVNSHPSGTVASSESEPVATPPVSNEPISDQTVEVSETEKKSQPQAHELVDGVVPSSVTQNPDNTEPQNSEGNESAKPQSLADIPPWEDIPESLTQESVNQQSETNQQRQDDNNIEPEVERVAEAQTADQAPSVDNSESINNEFNNNEFTNNELVNSVSVDVEEKTQHQTSVEPNSSLSDSAEERIEPSRSLNVLETSFDDSALVDATSEWLLIESRLDVDRFTANLAANMVPVVRDETNWHFILKTDMETFLKPERTLTLASAISNVIGKQITISIEPAELTSESPADYRLRMKAERIQLAVSTFHEDANVLVWKNKFGGKVLDDTIVPIDP